LGSPHATACWFLEPLLGEFEAAFRVSSSGDYSGNEVSMEIVFFVVMGSYAVRPNGFYGHPVTLTPRGFVILYEKEFIKDEELDPSCITDKTKADGFAKLVVCVQAFVSHIGFSPVYLLLDTS